MKDGIKSFPEGIKTGIAVIGINDKHTGALPEIVPCKSVRKLRAKLNSYLSQGAAPSYSQCLLMVKARGFITLIKKEGGGFRL